MAATEPRSTRGALVLAALAIPGVWAGGAHAQAAPEHGLVALKHLHYEDSQPGLHRITVDSPSFYLLAPIGTRWSVEGSVVADSLSGATPRWQTAVSSASTMHEERRAGDLKLTRYFDRASYSLGASVSREHDYDSDALSLGGSWASEDNNTVWHAGVGGNRDRIQPTEGSNVGTDQRRRSGTEFIVGVTQAMSAVDLVQVDVSHSLGHGYHDDPYKDLDFRPDRRRQATLLLRWNHHVVDSASTLRTSWRYYRDSYGIGAHALQAEWVQPFGNAFALTPLLRYYTQNAARFYREAAYDANGLPVYPVLQPGQLNSGDQRLSAFGAFTLGLKAEYKLDALWTVDAKFEAYEQRASWRAGTQGSPNLAPFRARSVQLGLSRQF